MAKSYLTPINLNGLELLNARLQQLASAPVSPTDGIIYYDTGLGHARIRTAGTWVEITNGTVYTDQQAQDAIGALVAAGSDSGITVTYNGTSHTLNFTVAADAAAGTPSLRTLGTGAAQATAGNDARLSDTRVPTDASVTTVKIVDANVTNVKIATGVSADKLIDGTTNAVYTLTERSKLAGVSNDAVAGTASQRSLGTGATQAAAGNDVRLSDQRTPLDGSVTNAKVATGISSDKLIDGTTNGVYTLTERSKLAGISAGATVNSTDASLRDRSTHTGTQSADTITNGTTNGVFTQVEKTKLGGIATGATNYTDTNARANRLDQFAVPTASLNVNSQLITNVLTPVSGTDAANKNYVDASRQGIDFKESVQAASAVGVNLALTGLLVVDGYQTVAGDRVLAKNQTTASANGIYTAAAGAWTRATDADTSAEVSSGMLTYVENGTTQGGTQWVLSTTGVITLNTTALTFTQFSGASTATAGNGLTATGNAFNVGSGTGITVGVDAISIDTTLVVRKSNADLGNGAATSFVITHNLGTRDVMVQVYTNSGSYDEVEVDIQRTSINTVTVIFATAPATAAYRAVIQG